MQLPAVDFGVSSSMLNTTNRLWCRLDGLTIAVREQKRVAVLKKLGLLEAETIPVFDEATQTAACFIDAPICILGIMVFEQLWLKSVVGLSSLGLMNELATNRKIPRTEAFGTYVVDSHQPLIIPDTLTEPVLARSILVQHYGIRCYLGTPLITAEGECIGTLGVMDLIPRQFTRRDAEFLALSARWCLREFERNHLLKTQSSEPKEDWLILSQEPANPVPTTSDNRSSPPTAFSSSINSLKLKLLRQLTQELRPPLTSVIGMSSVLRGEVFGELTGKQKEYLEIIHTSGQQMNSLVEEILNLGVVDEQTKKLQLTPVNIEIICQQALNSLEKLAQQKRQQLRLSVKPGKRVWLLDKEKVRQAIYYLVLSVIESSETGGDVRIHVSRRSKTLNIAVWISHPWLGDGLPQVLLDSTPMTHGFDGEEEMSDSSQLDARSGNHLLSISSLEAAISGSQTNPAQPSHINPQEILSLLLGCYLAESHGGKISVQGSSESGARYVLTLPKIVEDKMMTDNC